MYIRAGCVRHGERRKMLKDRIEEMKKEFPEGLVSGRGGCKFCGQIVAIEVPADWEDQERDELATEMCECISATIYTRKKQQKERAAKAIEKQFGADTGTEEEVKNLLLDIADKVIDLKINSGTIDIGNGVKAKIGITGKGNVKVERTKTEKATQEA